MSNELSPFNLAYQMVIIRVTKEAFHISESFFYLLTIVALGIKTPCCVWLEQCCSPVNL